MINELIRELGWGRIILGVAQTIIAGFCIYALLVMLLALG